MISEETQRRIDTARATLDALIDSKVGKKHAWGRLAVELFWEHGQVKTVKIHDEITVK